MRTTLDSTLAWWIAGPILGIVIVSFLALANKRFGVLGGVTDLVQGSAEGHGLRSWRALAVAAGVLVGVKLQPSLARAAERVSEGADSLIPVVQGADVL